MAQARWYWIPKPTHTHTHSEHVILIAFPLQQWLHERTSLLCYTYSTLHVLYFVIISECRHVLQTQQCTYSKEYRLLHKVNIFKIGILQYVQCHCHSHIYKLSLFYAGKKRMHLLLYHWSLFWYRRNFRVCAHIIHNEWVKTDKSWLCYVLTVTFWFQHTSVYSDLL
jgi:hypothetical protein